MLKKSITFEDLEGNSITEDFYFNLNKAELIELETSTKQGLAETLRAIIAESDNHKIVEYFKKVILMAYGIKSEDGRRFIKSDELRETFSQTDAYSELFIELATKLDSAVEFIKNVVPSGLIQDTDIPSELPASESTPVKDPTTMTHEELLEAFQKKMNP